MIKPCKTFSAELLRASRRRRRQPYLFLDHMDITIKVWIKIEEGVRLRLGWSRIMDTELQLQEEKDIMG
jgi:hypothetical protein